MSVTIDHIAKAAGVSTATVSRVINKNYPVSARAKKRVEDAIARLRYSPNVFARGLMKARTDSVGIIVPFISNPYHTEIVNAIENVLSKQGIFIYLCCSYADPDLEMEYVERLISRNVDALIIVEGGFMNKGENLLDSQDIRQPVIFVNEHVSLSTRHHIVRCAQEPGLSQAFDHMHGLEKRRILLLRGEGGYSFDLKELLFKRFRKDNDLDPERNPIIRMRQADEPRVVHDAAHCIRTLLKGRKAPRAVLAGNDLIAIGVLQGALEAGVKIPADLAIIGVDNTIVSQISRPQVSTVDLRMHELGRMAAKAYLELREKGFKAESPIRHTLESRLIHRETS
jgi:LacI family transcriptional regulator